MMVNVTAGCVAMYAQGAIIISIVAGFIYCLGSYVFIRLHVRCPQDPLDAFVWFCNILSGSSGDDVDDFQRA